MKFSIAICPPQHIVDAIKLMKEELAGRIKWFNSKNSAAHITLNTFEADETGLTKWKDHLSEYCKGIAPFEIILIKTGSFPDNGAFFLSPDDNSKKNLVELMKQFHQNTPFKTESRSEDPHISIARRLTKDKLSIAQELWGDKIFDLKFTCDNLAIRKFDENAGQYFIESRVAFKEKNQ